ncbi:MAG: RNA polymerase sigma factor [Candidatus Izemoplasmatales bacterium]
MGESLKHLVGVMQKGDMSVFQQFYDETYRQVFYMAYSISHDKSLAEDIMQDTYMKMIEMLPTYHSTNPLAYLLTIAKNLSINEYHKRKKVIHSDDYFETYQSIVIDNASIQAEKKEIIQQALSQLSDIEKDVYLLHNLENLRHREIALILDKPIGTITWLYQQANQKIKKWLEEVSK